MWPDETAAGSRPIAARQAKMQVGELFGLVVLLRVGMFVQDCSHLDRRPKRPLSSFSAKEGIYKDLHNYNPSLVVL